MYTNRLYLILLVYALNKISAYPTFRSDYMRLPSKVEIYNEGLDVRSQRFPVQGTYSGSSPIIPSDTSAGGPQYAVDLHGDLTGGPQNAVDLHGTLADGPQNAVDPLNITMNSSSPKSSPNDKL